jgi:hypothetical protein
MYKEVAVDPACLADDACFFALREQFGFEKGRYLIADSQCWLRDAMKAVKDAQERNDLKPVRAKTIKEWLNKSRKQTAANERQILLANDRVQSSPFPTWNHWLLGQQAIRTFDVCVGPTANPPLLYDFTQLSGLAEWAVSPGYSVDRNAAAIVSVLEPLLRISKDILLVDNYFNLGVNPVLAEFLRVANRAGGRRVTIVTGCDCASPAKVWANEYQHLVGPGFSCEWLKVPDRYFHDRYLITDTGAVKAGHGFSEGVSNGTASARLNLGYCGFDESQSVKQDIKNLIADGRATQIWSC